RGLRHRALPLRLFTAPATTEIYTLSLHDALPISSSGSSKSIGLPSECISGSAPSAGRPSALRRNQMFGNAVKRCQATPIVRWDRSEEYTSELQSRENLVCRLLLEKKKKDRPHSHS